MRAEGILKAIGMADVAGTNTIIVGIATAGTAITDTIEMIVGITIAGR